LGCQLLPSHRKKPQYNRPTKATKKGSTAAVSYLAASIADVQGRTTLIAKASWLLRLTNLYKLFATAAYEIRGYTFQTDVTKLTLLSISVAGTSQ